MNCITTMMNCIHTMMACILTMIDCIPIMMDCIPTMMNCIPPITDFILISWIVSPPSWTVSPSHELYPHDHGLYPHKPESKISPSLTLLIVGYLVYNNERSDQYITKTTKAHFLSKFPFLAFIWVFSVASYYRFFKFFALWVPLSIYSARITLCFHVGVFFPCIT